MVSNFNYGKEIYIYIFNLSKIHIDAYMIYNLYVVMYQGESLQSFFIKTIEDTIKQEDKLV